MSVLIFLFVVLKNMQTLVLAGGKKKKKKRSNSNLGNTGLENLSIQYFVFSI